jgi:L-threonine-O-3-phosphate decarboxylase
MPKRTSHLSGPPAPRAVIQWLPPVVHGALDFAELERIGMHPEEVIDFSTNTNPYGPPPAAQAAMRKALEAAAGRYPDRQALSLRRALSSHLNVPMESILAGNGSAELLWLTALAYLESGDTALLVGPTFGEYAQAARMTGAQVSFWTARPEDGFLPQPDGIAAALAHTHYRMVFVCNPNNPTGQFIDPAHLGEWADHNPDTLFVIDEAYLAFGRHLDSAIPLGRPNLLVLRSMTKDYALAGMRLGYAVGHPQVIAALSRVQPPWSVNALAQAAGIAALGETAYVAECADKLRAAKDELCTALRSLGYAPLSSVVHYFLLPVGNGAVFRASLRPYGLLIRDCASFGLPAYTRVAARKPEENQRLLETVGLVGSIGLGG